MFVDLYDVGPGGQPLTFIYNISVLDVFGPLFVYIISAGGMSCFVLLGWVVVTNKRKKVKSKH